MTDPGKYDMLYRWLVRSPKKETTYGENEEEDGFRVARTLYGFTRWKMTGGKRDDFGVKLTERDAEIHLPGRLNIGQNDRLRDSFGTLFIIDCVIPLDRQANETVVICHARKDV